MGSCLSEFAQAESPGVIPEKTMYKSRPWARRSRKVGKLIRHAELAAFMEGSSEPADGLEECPICFLAYPLEGLNMTSCCCKQLCTECYLQICPELNRSHSRCPFCNLPNLRVFHEHPVATSRSCTCEGVMTK
eukprot:m51a1_g12980 hypothetical protein (133) ;mRNA; f:2117-2699